VDQKGNQDTLHNDAKLYFDSQQACPISELWA